MKYRRDEITLSLSSNVCENLNFAHMNITPFFRLFFRLCDWWRSGDARTDSVLSVVRSIVPSNAIDVKTSSISQSRIGLDYSYWSSLSNGVLMVTSKRRTVSYSRLQLLFTGCINVRACFLVCRTPTHVVIIAAIPAIIANFAKIADSARCIDDTCVVSIYRRLVFNLSISSII